jgi:preprotein translocase subunit SecE
LLSGAVGQQKETRRGADGHSGGDMAEAARKLNKEGASSEGALQGSSFIDWLAEYPKRIQKYFHDVRSEMKLVNWPSWEDVQSTTLVVVVTVAFFAVYFLITDTIFSRMWAYFRHK